ncbi:MAG: 4-hydroxyphenylacetate decarboxylase large subunit [Oligoflexia bacterium]|nr:4-hydroxyphenylacetate decarboxylase large subunit [Oligoflexia bacterium]
MHNELKLFPREIKGQMSERTQKLLKIYYQTLSSVDNEFPYWYSRKYFELDNEVAAVRRAQALKEAFSHLTAVIFPGELIVMQKTMHYRGSFAMPWLSEGYFMSKEDEFYQASLKRGSTSADQHSKMGSGGGNVTKSFGKVVSIAGKFGIREEEMPALLELARMWYGKSVDDLGNKYEKMVPGYDCKEKIMRSLVCMFDSGYTLPQGREVINYYYPLQYGFDGLIKIASDKMSEVAGFANGDGMVGMNRLYNYQAIKLVLEGVQAWILNYAKEAKRLEHIENDLDQKQEYQEIYENLQWIAYHPPRSFKEALQLCWTLHIAVLNEDAISGLSLGRLGQVLYPYYENDLRNGKIIEEQVIELLELQRLKFTCVDCFASMGVVGGVLSGNTFNNLSIGGTDKDGRDASNTLEMLMLEAGIRCPTPQPTLSLLYDDKLDDEFLLKAVQSVKTGTGYPAFMNNRVAMEFLLEQYRNENMNIEEARAWSIGGCLETSPCSWMPLKINSDPKTYYIPGGSGQPTSVGVHFVSLPKVLELVLFDGVDQRTSESVLEKHNRKLNSYDELLATFKDYFSKIVELLVRCNNIQHDIWRKNNMAIFNSLLKPDCLSKGHLINELGYRYNATFNIETTGTINLINSLASLKKNIYDEKRMTLDELKWAIKNNCGYKTAESINSYSLMDQVKIADTEGVTRRELEHFEEIHSLLMKAPKYGNSEEYVDSILKDWEDWFTGMCRNYQSLYGHPLYACQISVSTHGAMGAVTSATPDGRLAGTTFADGSLSAYPGTDKNGPFALMNSATCFDHSRSQNTQLNFKLHPMAIAGNSGSKKLLELIRGYMRRGGFHLQFNVVDTNMLKDAQKHPENYRDLLVRVAGFTQYWVEIGKNIQDEVIARTEYGEM